MCFYTEHFPMADEEELGEWDAEDFKEPEVNVVRVEATEDVDLTLVEAKRREEEARLEALKPKAAAPAKATRAAEGGGGSSGAYNSEKMTEAEREEAQRAAEAASTKEMVSGLNASNCAAWAPKLVIASANDLQDLGRLLAERVHSVRGLGGRV